MKFEEIDFYDYKIRMCLDNGIRMYLGVLPITYRTSKLKNCFTIWQKQVKIVPKTVNLQLVGIPTPCQTRGKMVSLTFAT